jgi:hypothetical protein
MNTSPETLKQIGKFSKCIEYTSSRIRGDQREFLYRQSLNKLCQHIKEETFLAIHWLDLCNAFKPGIYPFLKSCEYTDKVHGLVILKIDNELKNIKNAFKDYKMLFLSKLKEVDLENKNIKYISSTVNNSLCEIYELRDEQENRFLIVEKENNELKSLVYSLLEQLNELKENNKCLTSRICELETLLE